MPTAPRETPAERLARTAHNVGLELGRHHAWGQELIGSGGRKAPNWSWEYRGRASIQLMDGRHPHLPVWNVTTDETLVRAHSDIMQEPLHAFLCQLYMTLGH